MINKPLSIIVAVGKNRAIGCNNRLLWTLPDDMKFFKQKTTGHTVIMGRNTYLSLPKGALPNRRNIVITMDKQESFPNCIMVNSIEEAIEHADPENENFIMGGASIYEQFFPLVQKIYYTDVEDSPEADTWFPEIKAGEWIVLNEIPHAADEKHAKAFTIKELGRR